MIADDSCLSMAEDVTYQSMGDAEDTVVLALRSGRLYTCNNTTAEFLAALDGKRTFVEVVSLLEETYDVPADRLRNDLTAMAYRLLDEGLIVRRQ